MKLLLGFRSQITLIFAAFLGLTLISHSFVLYSYFNRSHQNDFDSSLLNYAVDLANSLRFDSRGNIVISDSLFSLEEKIFPFDLDKTVIAIRTWPYNQLISKSKRLNQTDLQQWEPQAADFISQRYSFDDVKISYFKQTRFRLCSYAIQSGKGDRFLLQVASPMVLLEKEKATLIWFFLISVPLTLLIATITVHQFSRQTISPLLNIIRSAKEITAKKLNSRVPVPKVKDEIYELAATLNLVLDRLQGSFQSQSNFIADASHQMKTPLAILNTEIDSFSRSLEGTNEAVQGWLLSFKQEILSLSRTVEQLLVLARIDPDQPELLFQNIRIDEILLDIVAKFKNHSVVREKKLEFKIQFTERSDADYLVWADSVLLRSLFENILDNACKASPQGGAVRLTLKDGESVVRVHIADQGAGIPDNEKTRVFERFFTKGAGSGLGLSIVRRILEVHHGQVLLTDNPGGGAEFQIVIPKENRLSSPTHET